MGKKKAQNPSCNGCPQNCISDKSMQQKLLLQLHEQYAVNNNSRLACIITLLVGLFSVISLYGKVFVESTLVFEEGLEGYSLSDLLWMYLFSFLSISIMMIICIYQGSSQRCEQFITYAIRNKYHLTIDQTPRIFPNNYMPFNKNGLSFVQGLYGEFVKLFIITICLLTLSLIYKLIMNLFEYSGNGFCVKGIILCVVVLVLVLIIGIYVIYMWRKQKSKYKKREEEYKEYAASLGYSNNLGREMPKFKKYFCQQMKKILGFPYSACWSLIKEKICTLNNQKTHLSVQQSVTDTSRTN